MTRYSARCAHEKPHSGAHVNRMTVRSNCLLGATHRGLRERHDALQREPVHAEAQLNDNPALALT